MRYVELFAGAGGLSLGLESAGLHAVAHAEIEPHARAVLRKHWPDHWTATGTREDGTQYALSDTARYRLCGNGVGSPVAAWIARRLVWAEAQTP
jgi:site-specific DNA-cytosine methylase